MMDKMPRRFWVILTGAAHFLVASAIASRAPFEYRQREVREGAVPAQAQDLPAI